jgi:hypothetical protein
MGAASREAVSRETVSGASGGADESAARTQRGNRTLRLSLPASVCAALAAASPARATDEIQVYNAEIAAVGQFTVQQHLNYTFLGHKEPDFPGAFPSHHALNGTPEFAWGITKWFELGLYLPFAVDNEGRFLSDGFKLRTLFVTPDADKKNFFYGINFEYAYATRPFSETLFAMEIRPIIGWRNPQWEFIVNPIFDIGFGQSGDVSFAPAARLARKIADDVQLGIEYYSDLGRPGSFLPLEQQSHQLFAVTDFKVGVIDVDFGVGYGLTGGSDRWAAKTILSYAFPVAGKPDGAAGMRTPPTMKASSWQQPATLQALADPFAGMR